MSGWNRRTGCYELTWSQAARWAANPDLRWPRNMEEVATLLRAAGIEVVKVHAAWLDVRVESAGQLYEALSGKKSDPAAAAYFDSHRSRWEPGAPKHVELSKKRALWRAWGMAIAEDRRRSGKVFDT